MKFSNKDLYSLLFTELAPKQARCNTCQKVYKSGNSCTNQVHHLLKRHPDYQELAVAAYRKSNRFGLILSDQRTSDVFRWIEWCVMNHMPVNFGERPLTTLLSSFLRSLGWWSSGGYHFIAIMACLTHRFVLLAFCPLGDEEGLRAQSLFDLIADTLSTFNRPWESVLFMIGDNCSVNQEIGRKLGALPLIGCTSLRFQLAVNDVLANEETLLAKFHALMIHLSTITCRAALRKVTPLTPAVRNATHWSILFSTVERYTKLHPALQSMDHVTISKYGIARFMLSESETAQATELLSTLFDSHEVTKALQDPTLTLIGLTIQRWRLASPRPLLGAV
ncbi:hypothetical protein PPTG_24015 [Phytophthora nicotianae INRA-310]|uniref:BED-type domain-containing protein n=1 Tax=Phytophthora nicotianae (strain INRA-310) TaxID=761204 RepID=W2PL85_PHYN3|nr:hypothetical protein PPTG_24015 [Phytophthora nicotianae INRA-310]ETN01632.1 hypothetical protein PPTG_24015 [Phytophthora nicotianae INRA-310]